MSTRRLTVRIHAIAGTVAFAIILSFMSSSLLVEYLGDEALIARLKETIAWALLALQLLSLVIGAIAKAVSSPAHPLKLDAGFSISGWLAVLLTFLLARVFAEGTRMREDLEGTV